VAHFFLNTLESIQRVNDEGLCQHSKHKIGWLGMSTGRSSSALEWSELRCEQHQGERQLDVRRQIENTSKRNAAILLVADGMHSSQQIVSDGQANARFLFARPPGNHGGERSGRFTNTRACGGRVPTSPRLTLLREPFDANACQHPLGGVAVLSAIQCYLASS